MKSSKNTPVPRKANKRKPMATRKAIGALARAALLVNQMMRGMQWEILEIWKDMELLSNRIAKLEGRSK